MLGGLTCAALAAIAVAAGPQAGVQTLAVVESGEVWTLGELAAESRGEVDHLWTWDAESVPRRGEPTEPPGLPDAGDVSLVVRVLVPERRPRLPARAPETFELLAAPVEMWGEVPEARLPRWEVPPGGRVRLRAPAGAAVRLRLLGESSGSWWQDLPRGARSATVAAGWAADRELVVVGPTGGPLVDAGVTFLEERPGSHDLLLSQLRTEPGGRVILRTLPDAGTLRLVVVAPGHAPAGATGAPSALPAVLRLDAGAAVRGTVVDAADEPVVGARVQVQAWMPGGASALVERHGETDAGGRFTLADLPRGALVVGVAADGFAPYRFEVEVDTPRVELPAIILERGGELVVRVVDLAGAAIAGAAVDAGNGRRATAGPRGFARLRPVAASEALDLRVTADGYLREQVSVREASPVPAAVEVRLRRAFRLTGRLVDADGVPVAGGSVRLDEGPRFREGPLADDASFAFDLVPGTPVRLRLRSPATGELQLDVAGGGEGEIRDLGDLSPPPGVAVRGRVLAEDGRPLAGARVWAPRVGERSEVEAWSQGDVVAATADVEGGFRLRGLPRQPLLLRVDAPGFARCHLRVDPGTAVEAEGGDVEVGDVILTTGGVVEVRLADAEGPPATARVDLRGRWLDLDMLSASVHDGMARIRPVAAGRVLVTVVRGRELICEEAAEVGASGDEVIVDCDGGGLEVTGRVTLGSAPAGPGRLVWTRADAVESPAVIFNRQSSLGLRRQEVFGGGPPDVEVEVEALGAFATRRLRAGAWSVAWVPEDGAFSEPLRVDLPDADLHHVDLRFGGLALAGFVVDVDGLPVAGAKVQELLRGRTTVSRADGRFVLVGLDPGAYRLQAALESRVSEVAELLLPREDGGEEPVLRLRERQPLELAVVVVDGHGARLPAARVFVEREDRLGLRTTSSSADGRAVIPLDPPHPRAVRIAVFAAGRWGLGEWVELDPEDPSPLVVAATGSGSLRVEAESGTSVDASSPTGWAFSTLLPWIGVDLVAGPESPLELRGLPPGTYRLAGSEVATVAAVRDGETTTVELR